MSAKKILILGNSPACVSAIEEIRKADKDSEITLFSPDGDLPYQPQLLADLIAQEIKEDKVYCRPKDFCKANAVTTVLGKRIARINFRKSQITTEEKEAFGYDFLLISGTQDIKLPDVKGTNKAGVYGLGKLSAVKEMIKNFPFTETAVIQTNTIEGLKVAAALRKIGKEVVVVVPEGSALDPESLGTLTRTLTEQGANVIMDNSIAEILGDADAKAVRLKTGKVIGGEMIIFGEAAPDLRLFNDTALQMDGAIVVNAAFRTNIENVFAVNGVCRTGNGAAVDIDAQGRAVGAAIIGQEESLAGEKSALPAAGQAA